MVGVRGGKNDDDKWVPTIPVAVHVERIYEKTDFTQLGSVSNDQVCEPAVQGRRPFVPQAHEFQRQRDEMANKRDRPNTARANFEQPCKWAYIKNVLSYDLDFGHPVILGNFEYNEGTDGRATDSSMLLNQATMISGLGFVLVPFHKANGARRD